MWLFSVLLSLKELDKWKTVESAESFWAVSSKNNSQFWIWFYGITVQVFENIFQILPIGREVPTGDLKSQYFPWIYLLLMQGHFKFTDCKNTPRLINILEKNHQEIAERKQLTLSDFLRKAIISFPLFVLNLPLYLLSFSFCA